MALGALLIQEKCGYSDRETVEQITENPYLQYFIGLREYQTQPPFDPSLMVHFRKRFTSETLKAINEKSAGLPRKLRIRRTTMTASPDRLQAQIRRRKNPPLRKERIPPSKYIGKTRQAHPGCHLHSGRHTLPHRYLLA
jgi:Transposase domain (DUF772).